MQQVRYTLLIQLRLDIKMYFPLTGILSELVLDNRDHGKVVWLYSDCGVFYFDYKDGASENWAEKVSQNLLLAVAYDVGYVGHAVWDPLEAIWLAKTSPNDQSWQGHLLQLLGCQRCYSLM